MPNLVICDSCKNEYEVSDNVVYRLKLKNKTYRCKKCGFVKAAKSRPQNTKEYWERPEIKEKHSMSMKSSENYYESLKNRDTTKENNGMYNKQHTEETKHKMSNSRTGKKQSKETIEKRVKTIKQKSLDRILSGEKFKYGLNTVVRQYINSEHKWSSKVFMRDNFECVNCSSKKRLDAHHIKPFSVIVKELLKTRNFTKETTDLEKFNFLIVQKELLDENLENGKTLCRECHKKEHTNWGSHSPKTNNT